MKRKSCQRVRNLVFEGGGVRGIAYGGALLALEKRDMLRTVENVAGASAGAICAVLLALGMTADTITKKLSTLDFAQFQDNNLGLLRNGYRLLTKFGWNKGDTFKEWLIDQLDEAGLTPNATLGALHKANLGPELHVIGTSLTRGKSVVFNHKTHPGMRVVDAIRISMSLPVFFTAVKYENEYFVDGGVLNNYPIRLFDVEDTVNAGTLGFRVDSHEEVDQEETGADSISNITNIVGFLSTLINVIYNGLQNSYLREEDWARTIVIDVRNISATDFDLSPDDINFLLESGKRAVEAQLVSGDSC